MRCSSDSQQAGPRFARVAATAAAVGRGVFLVCGLWTTAEPLLAGPMQPSTRAKVRSEAQTLDPTTTSPEVTDRQPPEASPPEASSFVGECITCRSPRRQYGTLVVMGAAMFWIAWQSRGGTSASSSGKRSVQSGPRVDQDGDFKADAESGEAE